MTTTEHPIDAAVSRRIAIMQARRVATTTNYETIERVAGRSTRQMVADAVSEFDDSANASFVVKAMAGIAETYGPAITERAALVVSILIDETRSEAKAVKFIRQLSDSRTIEEAEAHLEILGQFRDYD